MGEPRIEGIGDRLRAARERLGWSREALAFHSGLSWSAIAQVESGRRTNLRPDTLSRLSGALGVSIDYLVGGSATPPMLTHQALLYDNEEALAETASGFLLEGMDRSEALLAVTTKQNIELLRKRLGSDAKRVELVDSASFLTTPDATLRSFGSFLSDSLRDGAPWVRIIGEPIWAGRTKSEVRLWTRFESLFNLVFGASPLTALCPYDERALAPAIVNHARVTHPQTIKEGVLEESVDYQDPGGFALED
jgi:transcriptional regulator with XRE-family HTH domain